MVKSGVQTNIPLLNSIITIMPMIGNMDEYDACNWPI